MDPLCATLRRDPDDKSFSALVTGGTGFLGTNLCHLLAAHPAFSDDIRVFGLPGSDASHLPPCVSVHYGDITKPADVAAAMDGVDIVFHVAGDTSFWRKHYARQRRVNVDGTRNVMEAAIAANVKRIVHTSTVDAMGYHPSGAELSEQDADRASWNLGWYNYAQTKREGEEVVWSTVAGDSENIEAVVLRPGAMIGPYDFTLQFGRLFFDLQECCGVPACPSGSSSFASVVAVANAHVEAALRPEAAGHTYIVAGENVSYHEMMTVVAAEVNSSSGKGGKAAAPWLIAPVWIMWLLGHLFELLSKCTGSKPLINPEQARFMSVPAAYCSQRAVDELGYVQVPLKQSIAEAHAWYKAEGLM